MSREERFKLGRSLRQQVPRDSMGDWKAPANRPDPVQQIKRSHEGRLDWLIPIRVGRMVASPYGFLRGTAVVMAEDVAHLPATGITPVICGDAHLGNFGFYASPERDLVIDLNDFDEAHPGAWEWDLRRLVASIWVAGRHTRASEDALDAAALSDYAGIVGHLLGKGHARMSGASMMAGYVGSSDKLDKAMCRFAQAYADQTEADHQTLVKAVARGVLPVEYGEQGAGKTVFRP